jgi:transposase InsO family protein
VKYAWIQQRQDEPNMDVSFACQLLSVPLSSYYSWLKAKPLADKDTELLHQVKQAFEELKGNGGSRSIKAYLRQHHQLKVSRRRIAKLLKKLNLVCQRKKKYKRGSSAAANDPNIAANHLQRQFQVSYPNQMWVGDISYIKTIEGWMYLAVVIDLYSRKVVGWALDTHMKSSLVEMALQRALWSRKPPKGLMMHTDQGSQYVSKSYRNLLKSWGIKASMSRRGNCWDNAVSESFFKTIKVEMVYRLPKLVSTQQMKLLVSEYMGHYNHIRPHSNNDYLPPVRYEQHKREQARALEEKRIPCTKKC